MSNIINLDFLSDFEKSLDKMDGVTGDSEPPSFWVSYGNHAVNNIMAGSQYRGVPQGRITAICGPSSAGKSYLTASIARGAQQDGAFVLAIDSENALDSEFMTKAGVNVKQNYKYVSLSTITQCTKIVSNFIASYRESYKNHPNPPKVVICIDSLDYLMVDSAAEDYAKSGTLASDQGLHTKKLKEMLRAFVQDIKYLPIAIVVTKQVYKARQDQLLAGEGLWVINDAIRYACSQIVLVTRLKLKDEKTKSVTGIRMKVEGFKTRFTKPFQVVTLEVPYDTGIDLYDGVFDIALLNGIIIKHGSWYKLEGSDENYRADDIRNNKQLMADIVSRCEKKNLQFIDMLQHINDVVEDDTNETKK